MQHERATMLARVTMACSGGNSDTTPCRPWVPGNGLCAHDVPPDGGACHRPCAECESAKHKLLVKQVAIFV